MDEYDSDNEECEEDNNIIGIIKIIFNFVGYN